MNKWLSIPNYEESYEVSDDGRVRSIDRAIDREGDKGLLTLKGKELKKVMGKGKLAYYSVMLSKKSKCRRWRVHQLVAETFIDNPDNFPCINHIDGDKLNNNVNNLEWCTYSHNNKHSYDAGLKIPHGRLSMLKKIESLESKLSQSVEREGKLISIVGMVKCFKEWSIVNVVGQKQFFSKTSLFRESEKYLKQITKQKESE